MLEFATWTLVGLVLLLPVLAAARMYLRHKTTQAFAVGCKVGRAAEHDQAMLRRMLVEANIDPDKLPL